MDTLKKEKNEKAVTVAMLVTLLCVGMFVFFFTFLFDFSRPPIYTHYNPIDTIICRGDSIIIIDVPQSKK